MSKRITMTPEMLRAKRLDNQWRVTRWLMKMLAVLAFLLVAASFVFG